MTQRSASPLLAQCRDGTVYLVLDDFGELGRAYRETDAAQADPKTVVADLLSGQYRHPLRVLAFNTAEGWARDVSQTSPARCSLARASWAMNCQLRCAISWSGRVRENSPELTPNGDAVVRRDPRPQLQRCDASKGAARPVDEPSII
jgi:hypothetical protein